MAEEYKEIKARFYHLSDTKENWERSNPILGKGEIGYDETLDLFKIGDGNSTWNILKYRPGREGTGEFSETFNDYENNKIYGQYSHVENKVGIVGDENKIDKIIASHFENESNANIQAYNSMLLCVDSDKPMELHRDIDNVSQVIDDVKVGDIIVVELSEKAKLYAVVSENASYSMNSGYYVIYKFDEYYLTDAFTFSDDIDNVKTLILRYDSKVKGYTVVQNPVTVMSSIIEDSHGEGNAIITDSYQHGEGYNTKPYGKGSHTEGKDTVTFGDYCHAEGNGSAAFGFSAHAEGSETRAIGSWSHAEGKVSYAYAPFSHAEGCKTNAFKGGSHTEGISTVADGIGAHAEGQSTQANGDQSHAEGSGSIAQGFGSHAEGAGTKATGEWSHAEGYKTEATEATAHAEGYMSKATAVHSHAEGQTTLASGDHSHTEGISTVASGINAHAEGQETIAKGNNQHVQGKFNIEDTENKYVDIIGNGTEETRANIQTVDWDGNIWSKGNIKIGGTSYDDENAKEIATKEYVDKKFSDTETKETIHLSLTYSGDGDDNSVWAKCWANMAVKCADIPEGFISVDSGNIAGIRVDNEWLNWNTFITEDMIDTSIPNVIYINYQNGSAEPQPITRAAIVKLAGTYDNFQIYSNSVNITFPESGIYLLDNHTIPAGHDYTSSLNITISVSTSGTDINNPADYNGNEIEVFNRGICIGDSVTEGAFDVDGEYPVYKNLSYPTILKKITNMEITNAGISGTTSTQWYNASINSSTNSGTWNSNNEWVWSSSVSALDYSGYDFAIIHLGINDVLQVSDTNTIDTVVSSYETSVKNIISKLKEKSAGIKIFLCTIIPNYAIGENWDLLNEKIKSIVTELDLVYLIDLTKYSKILNNTKYEVNHPTKTGYNQLAKELYAMISYEINKNLNDFNDINNTNITQKIKEYATKEYVDNQNNTLNNLVSTKSNKQNIVVISRTDENVTSEYELVCNTYQRYIIEKELTKLTLTMPEVIDIDYNFEMSIQIENVAPTWVCSYNPIKWHGVDCDKDGVFVPQSNTIYEISMRYIGTNSEGNKMISARVGIF